LRPLPIIQFSSSNEPIAWNATSFTKMGKKEKDLEDHIASNLVTLGLEEIANPAYQYKAFQQCSLPRNGNSTIYPDIIVIREDGELFIIEVKLADNKDVFSREAVGQIFEYASALSALDKTELALMLNQDKQPSSIGELFDHWFKGKNTFRNDPAQSLLRNIERSKINLLLVCDRLPSGVYDWIDDLTTASHLPFDFSAVEVTPFKASSGDSIMLIPQLKIETTIISRTVVEVKQAGGQVEVNVQPSSAEEIQTKIKKKTKSDYRKVKMQEIQTLLDYDLVPFDIEKLWMHSKSCYCCNIRLPLGGVCGIDIQYSEIFERNKGIEVKFIPRGSKDKEWIKRNQFARDHIQSLRDAFFSVFGEVVITREEDFPRWTFHAPSTIQYSEYNETAINQLAIQIYTIISETIDFETVDWGMS
jgi:hypothetical protein